MSGSKLYTDSAKSDMHAGIAAPTDKLDRQVQKTKKEP